MFRSRGRPTATIGVRTRRAAALGVLSLAVGPVGCGEAESVAGSGPCNPESLVWVYSQITDLSSPAYPEAVFRLQGGTETRLTDDDAASSPAVSPDGRQIVFERGSDGDPESAGYRRYRLYIVDSDGSNERPLLDPAQEAPERDDGAPVWDTNPMWSPDGSSIAFLRNTGFTESGAEPGDVHQVMVASADGSEVRPLPGSVTSLHDGGPAWSADGSELAWLNESTTTLHWASLAGDDSGEVQLPEPDGPPAWIDGDQAIVVPIAGEDITDGASGLYRVDLASGEWTELDAPVSEPWTLPTGQLAAAEQSSGGAADLVVFDPEEPDDRQEIASLDGSVTGPVNAVPDTPDGWAACQA